ncbi:MAG: V-type ATPase 116kDa subunit family protein, partial [Promethearchaeota archaeon]
GAIIGTFIVGILEGMLAFMNTLRLHFVEWFSKFFHAGGVAFAPFKADRIHTMPLGTLQSQESYAVS